ncbi:glycosyltransferase family protein [Leptothrix discophora]|uniref:Glycosyltransferase n=1 Tax=Leptothrix discophora TaxID=89 RepID=A0ABT9FZU3_LEPDI|nr:glycosyltransferase [Leptothrix discophora]MDP4299681.1 glycosyltransferase [Leptothrix discophora]
MPVFFLEESPTPIYARIARALGQELARRGHEVMLVKPAGFSTTTFPEFLRGQPQAVYLSTAGSNVIQQRADARAGHFFEDFPGRLIFLHQDALLGGLSFEAAQSRLRAWQRVADRSAHLCIEPDSVTALAAVGIERAAWVPHASEFAPTPPLDTGDCRHGASFVGHALPWSYQPRMASASLEQLLAGLLEQRSAQLDTPLHPALLPWVDRSLAAFSGMPDASDVGVSRQAYVHWLRGQCNLRTMAFRGRLLEQAAEAGMTDVTVYGGDPAYLHRVDRQATLGHGIRHEPPVYDDATVHGIYRSSACSINISSLQFDHAVVNRVHDVFMAGGLCLTDRRPGLPELTREHAAISYATPDELHDRVRHFSNPRHATQRRLLIEAVQRDVMAHSGYPKVVDGIEAMLQRL